LPVKVNAPRCRANQLDGMMMATSGDSNPPAKSQENYIIEGSFHTVWVNRVTLTLRQSLPVFLSKRTISEMADMSQRCHGTKSLRSSPLRGGKSREVGSRSRKDSDSAVEKLVTRSKVLSTSLRIELRVSDTTAVFPLQ
jgi:hypothetical protein